MKTFRPVLFLTIVLMLVGLACSALSGGNTPEPPAATPVPPTEAPTEEPTQKPTKEPTEEPTQEPTEKPSQSRDFFVEEFDSKYNPDDWQYFTGGDDDKLVIEHRDDYLYFDLGTEDLDVYYMYSPYIYDNVSLRLDALNQGRNNNNISLVCRMNEDATQWYEFSVVSGGVWTLWAYKDGYNRIGNGGTNDLRQGKEQNSYRMDCVDDEITVYVNDKKLNTIKDSKYFFNEGYVGFNVSSFNVLPVTVEINWFEIAQPE